MKRNWVYAIVREYRDPKYNYLGAANKTMIVWYSLQGWVDKRKVATFFSAKKKAESKVLLLVTENPTMIGQLEIVRLTRPKGMAVDV